MRLPRPLVLPVVACLARRSSVRADAQRARPSAMRAATRVVLLLAHAHALETAASTAFSWLSSRGGGASVGAALSRGDFLAECQQGHPDGDRSGSAKAFVHANFHTHDLLIRTAVRGNRIIPEISRGVCPHRCSTQRVLPRERRQYRVEVGLKIGQLRQGFG